MLVNSFHVNRISQGTPRPIGQWVPFPPENRLSKRYLWYSVYVSYTGTDDKVQAHCRAGAPCTGDARCCDAEENWGAEEHPEGVEAHNK